MPNDWCSCFLALGCVWVEAVRVVGVKKIVFRKEMVLSTVIANSCINSQGERIVSRS